MNRLPITGLILAGGRGMRLSGLDKGLQYFRDQPQVAQLSQGLQPQVNLLLISANRHLEQYQAYTRDADHVITDTLQDYQGPLAGIAAGLTASMHFAPTHQWLLVVPCDSPLIAPNFANKMYHCTQDQNVECIIAVCGEKWQHAHLLLKCSLADSLQAYLASGQRRIRDWLHAQRYALCYWPDGDPSFINLNTKADYAQDAEHSKSIHV